MYLAWEITYQQKIMHGIKRKDSLRNSERNTKRQQNDHNLPLLQLRDPNQGLRRARSRRPPGGEYTWTSEAAQDVEFTRFLIRGTDALKQINSKRAVPLNYNKRQSKINEDNVE